MHKMNEHPSISQQKLYQILSSRNQLVSVAESCTGGMVSSKIINVPGASNIIGESFVTYSNEAKIKRLGVSPEILNSFGSVSHECVKEMAENLQKLTHCDLAITISGLAGPTGGSIDKPIGTVWFGYWYNHHLYTEVKRFSGDRFEIREEASDYAIEKAIAILESN